MSDFLLQVIFNICEWTGLALLRYARYRTTRRSRLLF